MLLKLLLLLLLLLRSRLEDVVAHCENKVTIDFPIIADESREIAVKYGERYSLSNWRGSFPLSGGIDFTEIYSLRRVTLYHVEWQFVRGEGGCKLKGLRVEWQGCGSAAAGMNGHGN
jgi:hypothetical protein